MNSGIRSDDGMKTLNDAVWNKYVWQLWVDERKWVND